jgi:hypothetical protein
VVSVPEYNGSARMNAFSYTTDGRIDDIDIWNRALSAQEVLDLYNSNTVGISDLSQNKIISVYPNLAIDKINMTTKNKSIGKNSNIQ